MILHDFYVGASFDAYTWFGAHPTERGFVFRVYAPEAQKVALYGDFNGWQEEDMQLIGTGGVWEITIPQAAEGQLYKYVVYSKDGWKCEHCDPYGFSMELRPKSASRLVRLDGYTFSDDSWMKHRQTSFDRPVNIYEVHLGSWRTAADRENGWYNYEEIADRLIPYVKESGYTHIEMMPLSEHPSDNSWGYQNTGFFSPTSRYGSPIQLMKLVDRCHQAGIGVIMDFVPVHFALDYYGLARFDGSYLYEFPHDDVGISEWGSINFNHSRGEVASFLQSAAAYWLGVYHFDGLRVDAVSRLIYWQGDERRGVNDRAVKFLQNMNKGLKEQFPSCMLIAEDSTSYPKITAPVQYDGLGFDYKWDLGWMNDTLDYFRTPPENRSQHYHKLTFSMHYFYQEHYLLPFSHDETVHGKATILQKMWGDYEQKFPQARAMYLYMMTHPGKKLNFMGNEIGQLREWDEKREQDWDLRRYPLHDGFYQYIRRLNQLYLTHPSLSDKEYDTRNFLWLEVNGEKDCVYAYLRGPLVNTAAQLPDNDKENTWMQPADRTVSVFNFSDRQISGYRIDLPAPMELRPLVSSDSDIYGGSYTGELPVLRPQYDSIKENWFVQTDLAPFSGVLYAVRPLHKPAPVRGSLKTRKKEKR